MTYDSWKCTEPDLDAPEPIEDEHIEITDSSIERLLEDARLGDTVASATLVEACERALHADDIDEAESARRHIWEYLNSKMSRPSPPAPSSSSEKLR